MTTMKIYSSQNSEDFIEVLNSENEEIILEISLDGVKNIREFGLSKHDAQKLITELRNQFEL